MSVLLYNIIFHMFYIVMAGVQKVKKGDQEKVAQFYKPH